MLKLVLALQIMKAVFFILINGDVDDAVFFAAGLVNSDFKTVINKAAVSGAVDGVAVDWAAVDGVANKVVVIVRAALDEEMVVVVDMIIFTKEIALDEFFADAAFRVDGSGLTVVDKGTF
ncbi:hypothetical protein NDU88_002652 [Pleurodeles waltl]|uniref:Uncharacterized protein n=1 Tax=Pleurodeles waltl TaxID=8319 RepID=A0AAV7UB46_PLEWA|nr:hypothetical protein NDU88_002652 [Pleurodeles waltl]